MADKGKKKLKPEQGAVRKGKQGSYAVPSEQEGETDVEREPKGRDEFSGDES